VLASADPVGARSLADLLVCDVATAQEWTQSAGELTRIDVALPADAEGRAAAELAARLPPGVHLQSARAQARSLQDMTRAFDLNLRALSWLALLVGVFLVYNTMTFSVVQRRELIATLRTLGATRGEVFRAIGSSSAPSSRAAWSASSLRRSTTWTTP
jgi:putative ABC transport system permease protein